MKKLVTSLTIAAALIASQAGPAAATHNHEILHKDRTCTVLSKKGGESNVVLLGYEHLPENRRHPIHVKVHIGKPGQRGNIGVFGTMGCVSYRNL